MRSSAHRPRIVTAGELCSSRDVTSVIVQPARSSLLAKKVAQSVRTEVAKLCLFKSPSRIDSAFAHRVFVPRTRVRPDNRLDTGLSLGVASGDFPRC